MQDGLDHAPDRMDQAVMVIDSGFVVREVSDGLADRAGLPKDEIVGRHCYEVTRRSTEPCSGDDHVCPLRKVLGTGEPVRLEHICIDSVRGPRTTGVNAFPIVGADGDVRVALEMASDVPARGQAEAYVEVRKGETYRIPIVIDDFTWDAMDPVNFEGRARIEEVLAKDLVYTDAFIVVRDTPESHFSPSLLLDVQGNPVDRAFQARIRGEMRRRRSGLILQGLKKRVEVHELAFQLHGYRLVTVLARQFGVGGVPSVLCPDALCDQLIRLGQLPQAVEDLVDFLLTRQLGFKERDGLGQVGDFLL